MATDNFKRFGIPTALVVGGVTAGSLFAPIGLASAQDADAETDPDTTVTPEESPEDGENEGRRGNRGHRGRHFGARADVLTEALGLDAEEIKAGFQEGKSIADMAAEQNVAVDDVEAALVAAANERLDEAVENGRLDEAEADEKRAEIEERVENFLTQDPSEFEGRHGHRGHRGVRGFGGEIVQETLGLSAEEIRDGIQEGKTLSDLAAEQGVSVEDLAAAMVGAAGERIDEAVESGKIDGDVAAEKLAELQERIEAALNGELPERDGEGRRGRGFRGQRGGDTVDTAVEDVEDASF